MYYGTGAPGVPYYTVGASEEIRLKSRQILPSLQKDGNFQPYDAVVAAGWVPGEYTCDYELV